mmetsp:Transcript_53350/g.121612  ORF Transcript_53350/g.121612 Transcript_53350/m.121612 type:complete len:420 (+) Transcript_53350:938-2197(+)
MRRHALLRLLRMNAPVGSGLLVQPVALAVVRVARVRAVVHAQVEPARHIRPSGAAARAPGPLDCRLEAAPEALVVEHLKAIVHRRVRRHVPRGLVVRKVESHKGPRVRPCHHRRRLQLETVACRRGHQQWELRVAVAGSLAGRAEGRQGGLRQHEPNHARRCRSPRGGRRNKRRVVRLFVCGRHQLEHHAELRRGRRAHHGLDRRQQAGVLGRGRSVEKAERDGQLHGVESCHGHLRKVLRRVPAFAFGLRRAARSPRCLDEDARECRRPERPGDAFEGGRSGRKVRLGTARKLSEAGGVAGARIGLAAGRRRVHRAHELVEDLERLSGGEVAPLELRVLHERVRVGNGHVRVRLGPGSRKRRARIRVAVGGAQHEGAAVATAERGEEREPNVRDFREVLGVQNGLVDCATPLLGHRCR